MRIELIGCTSAGKSTLIAHLCRAATTEPFAVVAGYDYVLCQWHLGWVQPHKVRMALLNGLALSACLLDLRTHWRALCFARQILAQLPATVSLGTKLNLARLVMRNLGIDTLLRWSDHADDERTLILADEGTLQAVHYLFVHLATPPDLDAVAHWATLVPLPDLVIHLQQPAATLTARTLQRGHGRIPQPTVAQVTCFIERAMAVFARLVAQPLLQQRLVTLGAATMDATQATALLDLSEVRQLALHAVQQNRVDPQSSAAKGAVIAFVGPEATGKSTLVAATATGLATDWLTGLHMQACAQPKVQRVHVGKPSGGWLTWPVQRLLPLLRRLAPNLRTTQLDRTRQRVGAAANNARVNAQAPEQQQDTQPAGLSALVYALRAVNVAWERHRLLTQVHRMAAAGALVICDRYPSATVGAVDSPRLQQIPMPLRGLPWPGGQMGRWVYNRLVQMEGALYRRMAPPDVVIRLTVSLAVAKQRNRNRAEADKDDAYLLARRRQAERSSVAGRYVTHTIDTDAPLAETVAAVKAAVLQSLIELQPLAERQSVAVATAQERAGQHRRAGYPLERSELWER